MKLSKAISLFLRDSIHTHSKKAYYSCFNSLHRFENIVGDRPLEEIQDKELVAIFYTKLQEKHKVNTSTLYQVVLYLKKFFIFLGKNHLIPELKKSDLDAILDYRKIWLDYYNHFQSDLNPDAIDPDEEDELRHYWIHQQPTVLSLRNAAIIAILIDTGMKIDSLVGLKEENYLPKQAKINYKFRGRPLIGTLTPFTNKLLKSYVELRPGMSGSLFLGHTNNRDIPFLTTRSVYRILKFTSNDPIFSRPITGMNIRYGYISKQIVSGKKDKEIATNLGYSGKTLQRFAIAEGVHNKPEKNVYKYIEDFVKIEGLTEKCDLSKQRLHELLENESIEIREIKREEFAREKEIDQFLKKVKRAVLKKSKNLINT